MTSSPFSSYLLADEELLWTGAPKRGLMLTGKDVFLIPFSLLWCGFAIFWETAVLISSAPFFLPIFGGVFVCLGLFFVAGRFFVDAWIRGRTAYAVTDRRILIVRRQPFGDFTALTLDRLPDVHLNLRSGGAGDIRFGPGASMFNRGAGFGIWVESLSPTPQFLLIPKARTVFDLIQMQIHPRP